MGVREVGLGDQLLVEGDLKEHIILTVKEPIRVNMCYTLLPVGLQKTGEAGKYEFYNERPLKGKVKINFPCDPTQGVRYSEQDQKICAITIYGIASCASAPPDNVTRSTLKTGSFIRELLFTGYIDSKLRVTYREFVKVRQPALVVEIEHEISQLRTLVEYKGARLEIPGSHKPPDTVSGSSRLYAAVGRIIWLPPVKVDSWAVSALVPLP